jgi:hypothetical protein
LIWGLASLGIRGADVPRPDSARPVRTGYRAVAATARSASVPCLPRLPRLIPADAAVGGPFYTVIVVPTVGITNASGNSEASR